VPAGQRGLFVSLVEGNVRFADLPAPGGEITAEWLAGGGHFVFRTAHGLLDALSWIAGFDHGALESRALSVELSDGTPLKVCSYEDLVAMKQLAGRPRDREDLRELEALRTEEAEQWALRRAAPRSVQIVSESPLIESNPTASAIGGKPHSC
jgi:hypothetical protein